MNIHFPALQDEGTDAILVTLLVGNWRHWLTWQKDLQIAKLTWPTETFSSALIVIFMLPDVDVSDTRGVSPSRKFSEGFNGLRGPARPAKALVPTTRHYASLSA